MKNSPQMILILLSMCMTFTTELLFWYQNCIYCNKSPKTCNHPNLAVREEMETILSEIRDYGDEPNINEDLVVQLTDYNSIGQQETTIICL